MAFWWPKGKTTYPHCSVSIFPIIFYCFREKHANILAWTSYSMRCLQRREIKETFKRLHWVTFQGKNKVWQEIYPVANRDILFHALVIDNEFCTSCVLLSFISCRPYWRNRAGEVCMYHYFCARHTIKLFLGLSSQEIFHVMYHFRPSLLHIVIFCSLQPRGYSLLRLNIFCWGSSSQSSPQKEAIMSII